MLKVYFYLLDTLADWEAGYVNAELYSRRYFKKGAPELSVQTVSTSKESVRTMGGLRVLPDCMVEEIAVSSDTVLILPGADTWAEPQHMAVLQKASEILEEGGVVCGICGATVALANAGILNTRMHTSNGVGFLDMFAPGYKGQASYVDQSAVSDNNLITAGCTAPLDWAKLIIEKLDVFTPETLEAWYGYFSDGSMEHFFALMQTMQPMGE